MRIYVYSLIILALLNSSIISVEVKNHDKPIKGSWDFNLKKIWSVEYAGANPLADLSKIKCSDSGNIYTYDKKHKKLFVFDSEGKYLYNIGKSGEGPGEYKSFNDCFLIEKYVIIVDHEKLHYFLKNGKYLESIKIPKLYNQLPSYFISKNKYLYIPDGTDMIIIYGILEKKKQIIYNKSNRKGLKRMIEKGGEITLRVNSEDKPKLIIGKRSNRIYFGVNNLYNIISIDLEGKRKLNFSILNRKKERITQVIKEKKADKILSKIQGLSQDQKKIKKMLINSMPDYFNYFKKIYINNNGYIFVYRDIFYNQNYQILDIYSPSGNYLYKSKIEFPIDKTIKADGIIFNKVNLFAFLEDNEGGTQLVKYKINLPVN